MKLALCFVLCFCFGAFAQTVTNWDLSELNAGDSGIVEADKAPQKVLDRKAANQGYQSKITKSGKQTTLELSVYKERTPRVTDVDVLLFGFDAADDGDLTNMTFSYSETASVIAASLGSTWETQVHLPTEDLTYLELLRLAASLNEYTMIVGGSNGGGPNKARGPNDEYECICHGTAHKFPVEANQGLTGTGFKKTMPFWGVRILKKKGNTGGHSPSHGPHNNQPYQETPPLSRDCILCSKDDDEAHTDANVDCRYCCFGKCAVTTTQDNHDEDTNTLPICDWNYAGWTDPTLGYTRYPNAIGRCIKPRHLNCLEGVEEVGADDCGCEEVIAILNDHDTNTARCDTYCDKIVGWSDDFCSNCTETIWALRSQLIADTENCACEDAWWHQIHPGHAESGEPTEDGEDGEEHGESGESGESGSFSRF